MAAVNNNDGDETYYDILGITNASTATQAEIRKQYLRLAIQWHPDKHPPSNQDQAKAQFVRIGQAYETLSDPVKRVAYDRSLQQQRQQQQQHEQERKYNTNHHSYPTPRASRKQQQQSPASSFSSYGKTTTRTSSTSAQYDNYRDFFDATVAGMSEEELAAAVGVASVVGSIVGSWLGQRLANGGGSSSSSGAGASTARNSVSSSVLSTVGSVAGSMIATQVASNSVRALHEASVARIDYKRACQHALERGEPMPDPPSNLHAWEETWEQAKSWWMQQQEHGASSAGTGRDGGTSSRQQPPFSTQSGSNYNNHTSRQAQSARADDSSGHAAVGIDLQDLWEMAKTGLKVASEILEHAANQNPSRKSTTSQQQRY